MNLAYFKLSIKQTMIRIYSILILVIFSSVAKSDTIVTQWYGDKKAAVSMTFDEINDSDGKLGSQYDNAFPLMQQHNLKATFFVFADDPNENEILSLVADEQEIGSQGMSNTPLSSLPEWLKDYELSMSQNNLQVLTEQDIASFAYPYGDGWDESDVVSIVDDYYISARTANSWALNTSSPNMYALDVIGPNDGGTGDLNVISYLQGWVDDAVDHNKWTIEMFHDVNVPSGYDNVSNTALSAHMDYLVANEPNVWVAPMGTVAEYIYERDAAVVTMLAQDSNAILLDLQCGLDSSFNTPLTLLTDYPLDWEYCQIVVRQGQVEKIADIIHKDGNYYIMYDVLPDAETIVLSPRIIDLGDFSQFALHWLENPCNESNGWCDGADINQQDDVTTDDLLLLINEWLKPCPIDWPI